MTKEELTLKMDKEFVGELIKDYHEDTGIMLGEREILTFYAMEGLKHIKQQRKNQQDMMAAMRGKMFK